MIQFNQNDGGYLVWHTSGPLSGRVFEGSGCMMKIYS